MSDLFSNRLTDEQLDTLEENMEGLDLPDLRVSGVTAVSETDAARQRIEDAVESGVDNPFNDMELVETFIFLYQTDTAYCENKLTSLRQTAKDKRGFDSMVSAIKREAKEAKKRREEEERLYYQVLNAAKNQNIVEFRDLNELSTPLESGRYEYDGRKIFYTVETKEGSITHIVFPHAVVPVGIYRNVDEHTEKIRIAYKNVSPTVRGWQFVTVSRAVIADTAKIKDLAKCGISVNSDNAHNAMDYFCTLLDRNQASGAIPTKHSVARLGWLDDEFDCFIPYDSGSVAFDGDGSLESKLKLFERRGDLSEWLRIMAAEYKRPGSVPLRLAIAASLGSILMKPLNRQLFTLELWGATGTGKTVAMQAAASCWGNPAAQNALISTLDTTLVGRERLYGFYGNLPVFMDELQTLKDYGNKTAAYNEFIMHHSGGEGRARGAATEKMQAREHWHNLLILTGEEPVTKENSSGGAKNRVIEVEISQKLFEDPAAFVAVISENYGLVGEQWVNCMKAKIADPETWGAIKRDMNVRTSRITRAMHTDQKQAAAAAFLLEVDKLICKVLFDDYSIDPLEDDDIAPFVKDAAVINTGERAFDEVIAWVAENKPCFEEPAESFDELSRGAARQCYGRIKSKEKRIVIIAAALREFLENRGYDVKAVTKQWDKDGLLERGRKIIQTVDRINGISTRTYRLVYDFDEVPIE